MYMYIVKCSDDSYYTGVTSDLEKRLWQHNQGFFPTCYTFGRRPVSFAYCEECSNPLDAIAREKQVKDWSRKKKEALINGDYGSLKKIGRRKQSAGRFSTAPINAGENLSAGLRSK